MPVDESFSKKANSNLGSEHSSIFQEALNKKKKINLSTFNFQKLIKNLISCKSKKEI